jgi:putative Mg2+ transporter-C (MgtC) family protein
MLIFPMLARQLPRSRKLATEIQVSYEDGRGLLRTILIRCTELRFAIDRVRLDQDGRLIEIQEEAFDRADHEGMERPATTRNTVTMTMLVKGKRPVSDLIASLSDIEGIREVGSLSNDSSLD